MPPECYICCGVPIAALTLASAAEGVLDAALGRTGGDVHLCNAFTLSLADRDPAYQSMLQSALLNLPDGMSVVWASRRFAPPGAVMGERVYGPDLMLEVLGQGTARGVRHYFYGSSSERVLNGFLAEVSRRFPELEIAGAEVPPYHQLDDREVEELAQRIRQSDAHVVWVGIGTPKQDWLSAALAERSPAVCVSIGAAYDFISGVKSQAPRWMQRHGLEWLYRLGQEPQRLWRRYLIGNTRFVYAVWRDARNR